MIAIPKSRIIIYIERLSTDNCTDQGKNIVEALKKLEFSEITLLEEGIWLFFGCVNFTHPERTIGLRRK